MLDPGHCPCGRHHTEPCALCENIRTHINEEPAEVQIGYRLDCMVRELDELCAMAANPETVDLIESNIAGVGQVFARCKKIAAHLVARQQVAA